MFSLIEEKIEKQAHTYGYQLTFDKTVKVIHWLKYSLSANGAGTTEYYIQKNLDLYLVPYTIINPKWITKP